MKNVIILTVDNDPSTDEVIDWLYSFDWSFNVCRINNITELKEDKASSLFGSKNLIWNRKYRHLVTSNENKENTYDSELELKDSFKNFSNNESKVVIEYLIKSEKNLLIGNSEPFAENKPYQLEIAEQNGINIPKTLVTNSKSELMQFINANSGDLICKPLRNALMYMYNNQGYCTYTTQVNAAIIKELPDYFVPTLFQVQIEKEFEIRTFYLYEQCWSMAIFSQQNDQTAVDFRMYNIDIPNRNVPYLLSKELEDKIKILMKALRLNTGSLDFIQGTDGNIYFLEVNPEGQFGMVSYPCNYNIEETIARKIYDERKKSL